MHKYEETELTIKGIYNVDNFTVLFNSIIFLRMMELDKNVHDVTSIATNVRYEGAT